MSNTVVINIMRHVNEPELFRQAMEAAARAVRDGKLVVSRR